MDTDTSIPMGTRWFEQAGKGSGHGHGHAYGHGRQDGRAGALRRIRLRDIYPLLCFCLRHGHGIVVRGSSGD